MPLTGHVDRNVQFFRIFVECVNVVPLTGHVDRNHQPRYLLVQLRQVVPLTGHVDRNTREREKIMKEYGSCPSRGTWIEMSWLPSLPFACVVVPLTGHVDRNIGVAGREVKTATVVPLTGHVDRNVVLLYHSPRT